MSRADRQEAEARIPLTVALGDLQEERTKLLAQRRQFELQLEDNRRGYKATTERLTLVERLLAGAELGGGAKDEATRYQQSEG